MAVWKTLIEFVVEGRELLRLGFSLFAELLLLFFVGKVTNNYVDNYLFFLFFYCDCDNYDDCDITCDSYIKFIVSRFNYLCCYFDYFLLLLFVVLIGLLLLFDI